MEGCWCLEGCSERAFNLVRFFFVFNTLGILPIIYIFFFQNFGFSKKEKKRVLKRGRKSGKAPRLF